MYESSERTFMGICILFSDSRHSNREIFYSAVEMGVMISCEEQKDSQLKIVGDSLSP